MDVTIRYVDTPRVFGALIVPQRAHVILRVGDAAYAEALSRLPLEARVEYETVRVDGWCRGETAERVLVEAAHVAGVDARELTRSTVHAAIRGTVGKLWRALLVMTSDLSLVRRTPMFYARSYDRGSLTAERIAPGVAELFLEGWPDVPELHAVAIAAGVRAVLELAGRKDVVVDWRRDGENARFDITWRP